MGLAEPEPDASQDGPLNVHARIEYSSLVKGQTRSVFGLVTVKAAEDAPTVSTTEERQSMDLVCVLDISGSMRGDKIEELKKAIKFIINEAGPNDRLSIVTFQSFAERKTRLAIMNEAGKDEAMTATMRLTATGGTRIAEGLRMAMEVMEQRRQRNKVSAILLLTDGQDNSSKSELPGLLSRAAAAGCSVYGFGFGADHDSSMMREIAEQARTPYTFVESADSISEAFAGVVGGLSSIVAQSVELQINCHVGLTQVNTPFEVRRAPENPQIVTVMIPDIFAAERRDVLLELAVPADLQANAEGLLVVLEASLRYRDLRHGDRLVRTAPVALEVSCVDEPQPEMEPDAEVADQRDRVEVTRALEQAAASSDAGNFRGARQMLQEHRAKVSRRSTAVSRALEEELEDAEQRMQDPHHWSSAGRAEVQDAMQMHKMQRTTNVTASSSATLSRSKTGKAMYVNSAVMERISKTHC